MYQFRIHVVGMWLYKQFSFVLNIKIKTQVPSIQYQVSSTKYRGSIMEYQLSIIQYPDPASRPKTELQYPESISPEARPESIALLLDQNYFVTIVSFIDYYV